MRQQARIPGAAGAGQALSASLASSRRRMTSLAAKLAEIGVQDVVVNICNKVARGRFSAVFFAQCLQAIGCQSIRLD
jgi:3-mercaptopyruvate sulfurtransferase SseA